MQQIIHWIRKEQTPKTFATVSKYGVGISLAACIIFYNIGFDKDWYMNTPYTTFFKGFMLLGIWISDFLACKWFLTKNCPSHRFYQSVCLTALCLCVAISAQNFIVLGSALFLMSMITGFFVQMCKDGTERAETLKYYILNIIIFFLLLGGGIFVLYYQTHEFSYQAVTSYYQKQPPLPLDCLGGCLLMGAILYLLGAVPFHLMQHYAVRQNILPVAAYMTLILPVAGLSLMIALFHKVLGGMSESLSVMMMICGLLSVIMGVVGAGANQSVRMVFACVGMFNMGIILILFSYLDITDIQAGIMCFLIYFLSIFGVYTCFYGIRSHGEYVDDIKELAGLNEVKPYISGALLVFCISLLGIPPLMGLLGNLALINSLLAQNGIIIIAFIFLMLTVLAHGLLRIVKSIYFDNRKFGFDRVDKGVYLCLLINVLIMLITVIHPKYLMYDVEEIIHSFLL